MPHRRWASLAYAELCPRSIADGLKTQHQLTSEIREYRRVGGRFEFAGLPEVKNADREIPHRRRCSRNRRDSRHYSRRRPRLRVARNRASAARRHALRLDRGECAFRRHSGFHHISCACSATRFCPMARSTIARLRSSSRIRREMEKQRRQIQESLRGYLRKLAEGGTVQDELITIRGERFVIPVKVEQKRRVQGVVHGASSSGQTVFVEPLETIEQNNELVRLLDEEQVEIHRVLLEMTRQIGENAEAISSAADSLAELELQFAKAHFAEDYNCVAVSFPGIRCRTDAAVQTRSESALSNSAGRNSPHSPPRKTSSARTQSKTKNGQDCPNHHRTRRQPSPTGDHWSEHRRQNRLPENAGLLALMAQSGIPVPADRAEMPVFDAILADIGDYQSIEQNLSTFSAHVTNIDFISRTATSNSLVLLDELGSATDPEEGAALAVAIAEHFREDRMHDRHLHPPHFAQSLRRQYTEE